MTETVDFSTLDSSLQDLIKKSVEARKRAYCPYSKFQVGCALLCKDNSCFLGCNVENVSYGLAICAERTAIVSAIAAGKRDIKVLAVCAELGDTFVPPCGACRQFIAEFGSDIVVMLVKPQLGLVLKTNIQHLLPLSFNLGEMHKSLTK